MGAGRAYVTTSESMPTHIMKKPDAVLDHHGSPIGKFLCQKQPEAGKTPRASVGGLHHAALLRELKPSRKTMLPGNLLEVW